MNNKNKEKIEKIKGTKLPLNHKFKLFYIGLGITVLSTVTLIPITKKFYKSLYDNNLEITHYCWFDLETKDSYLGRIDIGLFGNSCPKSINNYLSLIANDGSIPFSYAKSNIFRMIPQYLICFGDVKNNDGTGHYSIYSNEYIENEIDSKSSFEVQGVVGLCNKGKDTNGSSFFITLDEIPSLKGQYTVIGKVVEGLNILNLLSSGFGNVDGTLDSEIKIADCGIYKFNEYVEKNQITRF